MNINIILNYIYFSIVRNNIVRLMTYLDKKRQEKIPIIYHNIIIFKTAGIGTMVS